MKIFKNVYLALSDRRKRVIVFSLAAATGLAIWAGDHHRRWEIYLQFKGVPKIQDLPLNRTNYIIEELPFYFGASFARNHDVYFVDGQGWVYQGDDRGPAAATHRLGNAQIAPHMIFVSRRGTIFVSGVGVSIFRSTDGGQTWKESHALSVWRMSEDETSNTLYAGVYTRKQRPLFVAKLLKSTDDGETWQIVFEDHRLDHIHSVRWDLRHNRLYISAGDGAHRGQAYSDDRGKSWTWINSGGKQGHTDVAISDRYVFWGSDDNLGRVVS